MRNYADPWTGTGALKRSFGPVKNISAGLIGVSNYLLRFSGLLPLACLLFYLASFAAGLILPALGLYHLSIRQPSVQLHLMPRRRQFSTRVFLQCFGIVFIMLLGIKHIFPALLASHASGARATQVVLSDASAEQPQTGNVAYTLPTERTFLLNVPAAYTHEEPHPLVLSFHGAGGFSEKQQRITELSDPSLNIAGKPFLTAYAQGVNNTEWNMRHIWKGAPYENNTVDDIAYVFDIIKTISSTYTIDQSRIYACGKSNGGGFTSLLACRPDTSSIIAAFAPVSPALYQGTYAFHNCTPSRPAPIFHIHGIEDVITPFYGRTPEEGSFGPEPDVRLWRRQWAERNGCARGAYPGQFPQPDSVKEVHPGAWEEIWDCPGAEVRALSVEGLGHAWPSTIGLDLAGRPNQTANFNLTNQHLVQFFSRHSLGTASG